MDFQLGKETITLTEKEFMLLKIYVIAHCDKHVWVTRDYNGDIWAFSSLPDIEELDGKFWYTNVIGSATRCVRSDESKKVWEDWKECIVKLETVTIAPPNDGWNYIEDGVYPKHGQHVIVWDLRDNVYQGNGDNEQGQVQGGDCFYADQKVEWDRRPLHDRMRWNDDFEHFLSMNGSRHRWNGHGPCSFNEVVAWRPFPSKPSRL